MSRNSRTVPAEEISLNLDLHGFEPDDTAPSTVEAELSRSTDGAFLLVIESDGPRWVRFVIEHVDGEVVQE